METNCSYSDFYFYIAILFFIFPEIIDPYLYPRITNHILYILISSTLFVLCYLTIIILSISNIEYMNAQYVKNPKRHIVRGLMVIISLYSAYMISDSVKSVACLIICILFSYLVYGLIDTKSRISEPQMRRSP